MVRPVAAVYLRVSTRDQDVRNQERACVQLVEARGWTPLVVAETVSGAARERPGWERVQELARTGQVRAVVVWSLDRVGRTMFRTIGAVQELAAVGCQFVSVREPWLDTAAPTAGLMLAIFSWVAQFEHERIRERTRAGLERAAAAGRHPGRPAALSPSEASLARQMRRAGQSWNSIASDLEFARTDGSSVSRSAVRRACAENGCAPARRKSAFRAGVERN